MNFEIDYIEKLSKILKEQGLTEILIEDGEKAIQLRKEVTVAQAAIAPMNIVPQQPSAPAQTNATEEKPSTPAKKGTPITSPMVGTFYAASSPDAAPFVKVGDTISSGKVVCIIEAMKLMNEIKAEHSGKVTQICVKNGDPIEFGQVLMYVE